MTEITTSNHEPGLAPPGAGLPAIELFFARLLFRWKFRGSSREKALAWFQHERDRVLEFAGRVDAVQGRQRVLIPRLRGMEDSSRYWSVFMTLDHLRIVNAACTRTIRMLLRGHTPPGQASTAAVKPSPDAGENAVNEFAEGCADFHSSAAEPGDFRTKARFPHPWFGLLDARGWRFMAPFHMSLHRQQIEAILMGLKNGG